MEASQATATGATRVFSVAILGERGVGVEVLVVPALVNRAVEETASVLGVELTNVWASDFSAAQLPERVRWLFDESVASGALDPSVLALEGLDRFADEVVFARQVPVERSPVRSWSIAELWTTAAGPLGGVGAGFASGTHWPIALVCGVFGTLLIRPIAAVSAGVAQGLQAVAQEATEEFARDWLQRHGVGGDKQTAPESEPPLAATAGDSIDVEAEDEEEWPEPVERINELLELEGAPWGDQVRRLGRIVERQVLELLARLDGIAEVLSERINRRSSQPGLRDLLGAVESASGLFKEVYDPLADERSIIDPLSSPREKTSGSVNWAAMPAAVSALGSLVDELPPVIEPHVEFQLARRHLDPLRQIHPLLDRAFKMWSELPSSPPPPPGESG